MLILQLAAKPHGVACPPANDEIRVTTLEEIEEMSKSKVRPVVIRASFLIRHS